MYTLSYYCIRMFSDIFFIHLYFFNKLGLLSLCQNKKKPYHTSEGLDYTLLCAWCGHTENGTSTVQAHNALGVQLFSVGNTSGQLSISPAWGLKDACSYVHISGWKNVSTESMQLWWEHLKRLSGTIKNVYVHCSQTYSMLYRVKVCGRWKRRMDDEWQYCIWSLCAIADRETPRFDLGFYRMCGKEMTNCICWVVNCFSRRRIQFDLTYAFRVWYFYTSCVP